MQRSHVIVAACLAVGLSTAWAGRPLQGEDAPVIDAEACEIEGAYSNWRAGGDDTPQTYLQLACGVGAQTEIGLQLLTARELGIAGKTQLLSTPWRAGQAYLSLAWAVTGRRLDTTWRRSGAVLNLAATLPISPDWMMHAMLGHQRDELQRTRSTNWALGFEHNGMGTEGRWQPMAEVFGDDHGKPWLNVALRLALVPERLFIDASAGRRLGGSRAQLMTAGFKFAF